MDYVSKPSPTPVSNRLPNLCFQAAELARQIGDELRVTELRGARRDELNRAWHGAQRAARALAALCGV